MNFLSPSQLDLFAHKGYLIVPGLLEKKYVMDIQNEIWDELDEAFGIKKLDRETWKTPLYSPRKAKFSPTNKKLITQKFRNIIDDLIGADNWTEPNAWGGFLVNFPEKEAVEWTLNDKLWHWDYELHRGLKLKGLLIFSFFSKVLSKGGGTLLVSGSHKSLQNYYNGLSPMQKQMKHGAQRKHFMATHPYFKKLTSRALKEKPPINWFVNQQTVVDGVPLQVIELTGDPGDVVFCHPRMIHAPAGINLSQHPRMMRSKFLW